jgi:hypothetical protein
MTQELQELSELNLDLSSESAVAVAEPQTGEPGEVIDAEFQVEQPPESGPASSISDSETAVPVDLAPKVDPRSEMVLQIESLQREVADQACEVSRLAGVMKSAKKEFDGLVEELRDLERRFESGDYGLAFDPAKSAGDVPAGTGAGSLPGQKTLPLPDPNSPDELAWRSTALSEIGLSGKLLESLEDAGLKTMGLLADYTAAGKLLTDIAGIGKGKAEKIEQACEGFWASRSAVATDVATTATTTTATHAPSTIEEANEAGAENAEEIDAYAAGCGACIEGNGPEANPHKGRGRLWQMFDRGWQDTNSA